MAVNRNHLVKQLEPGLNAIFGEEYARYPEEHLAIFDMESSVRAFEEEVLMTGFGAAPTKAEGAPVSYDEATEQYMSRYQMETIALAFAITEEAVEDNLYGKIATRLSKALARSMAHTKQIKGAGILNNGFNSSFAGGDGKELLATDHPTISAGNLRNELTTAADLSETSLETALIDISDLKDDKGIPIHVQAKSLIIPTALVFVAERLLQSTLRPDTANNDVNAVRNMGFFPGGVSVNHRLTDTDAWFIKTDCPDGLKGFTRMKLGTKMEGDFETGNMRYKARERYIFGFSDWRGVFGSPGA